MQVIYDKCAQSIIPPRCDAIKHEKVIFQERNKAISMMEASGASEEVRKEGRKSWKIQSGYHKRSLVEVVFSRIKHIFGGSTRAKKFKAQSFCVFTRLSILNRFTHLEMRKSYATNSKID